MINKNDVIPMSAYKNKRGFATPSSTRDNNHGGGNNMDNHDFVTHKEFDDAMHKIDKRFDHIDTKFAEQSFELYKAMVGTGISVVTILGFLIALFAFLK